MTVAGLTRESHAWSEYQGGFLFLNEVLEPDSAWVGGSWYAHADFGRESECGCESGLATYILVGGVACACVRACVWWMSARVAEWPTGGVGSASVGVGVGMAMSGWWVDVGVSHVDEGIMGDCDCGRSPVGESV